MSAVPKLRFPEFDGEFETKLLEEIANVYQPKTISQSDLIPDGEYVVYGANGVIGRYSAFNHAAEQVAITCRGNTCGRVNFTPAKAWITGNAMVLNMDANADVSKKFIYYLSTATDWTYQIAGSGQPQITGTIKKHKFQIPSLPEQQKIASFLSSVDKKIDLLRQKKDALELYKKGLMQKIFSQEIRFKQDDGSDFPDWEEVALGDVGEFSSAGVDKKIVPGEEEVRLLNFTNVYKQTKIFDADLNQVVTAPIRKVEQCDVKKGDIFFTPSSETRDDIGLSAVAAEDMSNVVYSYHVVRFRLTQEWDFNFSCFAFDRKEFRKQCYLAGDGSGQRYVISQNAFRRMILDIPSLAEQAKIGSALAAINSKIEKSSSQIDQMETFKKGLLQQMFV